MLETAGALFAAAAVNLRSTWRSFAMTDLAYKAIAFAVLMPATSWLIYWFRAGTSHRVIADVDIARFFITTPVGIVTLIVGTSMILAITALEIAPDGDQPWQRKGSEVQYSGCPPVWKRSVA